MLYLTQLQEEVAAWSRKNFPNNKPHQPLLGLAEEVGELAHAHLKDEQGIRHSKEECKQLKADAIGDIVIFLCDYCARNDLSLINCVIDTWDSVQKRDWTKHDSNP